MTVESINVLVTPSSFAIPMGDECLQQIAAISPKIKVRDVFDLVSAVSS